MRIDRIGLAAGRNKNKGGSQKRGEKQFFEHISLQKTKNKQKMIRFFENCASEKFSFPITLQFKNIYVFSPRSGFLVNEFFSGESYEQKNQSHRYRSQQH